MSLSLIEVQCLIPYGVSTIVVRSASLDISRLVNGPNADAGTLYVLVDGIAIVRLGRVWSPAGGASSAITP